MSNFSRIMAGLLFSSSGVDFLQLWLPILITILVVAFCRLLAVYIVTKPLNALKLENPIPSSWEKLLSWASLRGALSIIILLLIPEDFTVEGWTYEHAPRDFLLALTVGCILATLFIKAPMIIPIIKKLNIGTTEPLKEAHSADLGIYFLLTERSRLLSFKNKGFINAEHYDSLLAQVENQLSEAQSKRNDLVEQHGQSVFDQSLHLSMIHQDTPEAQLQQRMEYYRAQMIMARKAVKIVEHTYFPHIKTLQHMPYFAKIAHILGRHHSTIYREVQRNTYLHDDPFMLGYFYRNA